MFRSMLYKSSQWYKWYKNPRRSHITCLEKEALTSLTNNDVIIIKPGDKGGAIVVMNRKYYIAEGLRQLNDEKFYQKLEEDLTTPR